MADDPRLNRRIGDTDDRLLEKILGFERSTHEMVAMLNNKIQLMELENKHTLTTMEKLVSKLEFTPVQRLVYGAAAIMLMGVMGALLTLVVK
jgi:hypothetical protein